MNTTTDDVFDRLLTEPEADKWAEENACTLKVASAFGAEPTARKDREKLIKKTGREYLIVDGRFGLKPYMVVEVTRPR